MDIVATYGFDSLSILGGEYPDFTGILDLPFKPLNYLGVESYFKFVSFNGRVWIRSRPKSSSRKPSSRCMIHSTRGTRGYSSYRVTRRRREHSSIPTNRDRQNDSLRRTLVLSMPTPDPLKEPVHNNGNRYATIGFSLYIPSSINDIPSILTFSSDHEGRYNDRVIFDNTDIKTEDINIRTTFLEVIVDKVTGLVRRWVNDKEIKTKQLYGNIPNNISYFHIGKKSTSTAGDTYRTQYSRYSYYGVGVYCPTHNSTSYAWNTGAPTTLQYGVTDFYFGVSKQNDVVSGKTPRLGPIEVKDLNVENFELNRHWLAPTSADTPTETVNRVKIKDSIPNHRVSGDTHADPGKVRMGKPNLNEYEEVVYLGIDVYGYRDVGGADKINVETRAGGKTHSKWSTPLPTQTLTTKKEEIRATTLSNKDVLSGAAMENLELYITFD